MLRWPNLPNANSLFINGIETDPKGLFFISVEFFGNFILVLKIIALYCQILKMTWKWKWPDFPPLIMDVFYDMIIIRAQLIYYFPKFFTMIFLFEVSYLVKYNGIYHTWIRREKLSKPITKAEGIFSTTTSPSPLGTGYFYASIWWKMCCFPERSNSWDDIFFQLVFEFKYLSLTIIFLRTLGCSIF